MIEELSTTYTYVIEYRHATPAIQLLESQFNCTVRSLHGGDYVDHLAEELERTRKENASLGAQLATLKIENMGLKE